MSESGSGAPSPSPARLRATNDSAARGAPRSIRSTPASPVRPPRVRVPGNSASIMLNIAPGRWAEPSAPLSGHETLT